MYDSDSQSYNDYYNNFDDSDNDAGVGQRRPRNAISDYTTVRSAARDDSGILLHSASKSRSSSSSVKRPRAKKKNKTSDTVQISGSVARVNFAPDGYLYCLKCNAHTDSTKLYVVRDTYDTGMCRYRLCKTCKACGSKGCRFLTTIVVDQLLRAPSHWRQKKIR